MATASSNSIDSLYCLITIIVLSESEGKCLSMTQIVDSLKHPAMRQTLSCHRFQKLLMGIMYVQIIKVFAKSARSSSSSKSSNPRIVT